jgi:hypothetical protein
MRYLQALIAALGEMLPDVTLEYFEGSERELGDNFLPSEMRSSALRFVNILIGWQLVVLQTKQNVH